MTIEKAEAAAEAEPERPVIWIGSSLRDLRALDDEVKSVFGFAIYQAQRGGKHIHAKPLKGIGGGILEVVEDHAGNTFRAVYTVRFEEAVYVLHVFQKKSKKGIATPQHEIDLIEKRFKVAKAQHEEWKT